MPRHAASQVYAPPTPQSSRTWHRAAGRLARNAAAHVATSVTSRSVSNARRSLLRELNNLTRSRAASTQTNHHAALNDSAVATRAAVAVRHGYNQVKRKKSVHVSAPLRAKIQKVMNSKLIHGWVREISYTSLAKPSAESQGSNDLADPNDYSAFCFDVEDMIHHISVLWNQKTDSQTDRHWYNTTNFGFAVQNPTNGTSSLTTSSTNENWSFGIKSCYARYRFKNNTQRTIIGRLYLCSPKRIGVNGGTYTLTNPTGAPTSGTAKPPIENPPVAWTKGLIQDNQNGININNMNPTTLYANPVRTGGFSNMWHTDVTELVLEPGQTYTYTVEGPKDLEVHVNKLLDSNGYFMGIQKFMRWPMFVYHNDLANTAAGSCGRWSGNANQYISVERERYSSYYMPEQTLGRLTVAASTAGQGPYQANLRRNAYFWVNYNGTGDNTTATRVDEENPSSTTA